ncbi:hypothetical protein IQ250_17555, partial [Pseudanabaenaceae cyanobacterium LEGE 13415]|nr:hypothetical protein [Pseudanabaenaceae cyanobacterium LEGE 13415]
VLTKVGTAVALELEKIQQIKASYDQTIAVLARRTELLRRGSKAYLVAIITMS